MSFLNPEGGHALGGTLTRPFEDAPFPAVVLISGSGPQDRDESLAGHRPFLVLADHLARNGIAALRYDDRGVGASGGDFSQATTEDFATDALAAVAYLKSRDDIDPGAIGLAGHSEGGLVAPMSAVRSSDVAFLVLMAAPGVDGARILIAQGELIARAGGATEEAIAANRERQEEVFSLLREEPDPAVASSAVEAVVRHDPAAVLEQVTVPVLAMTGEKDLQVPHEENLSAIAAALERGGNRSYEVHALPGLNHLFQHAETGAPSEYSSIEETWSVDSMQLLSDWIRRTASAATPQLP